MSNKSVSSVVCLAGSDERDFVLVCELESVESIYNKCYDAISHL